MIFVFVINDEFLQELAIRCEAGEVTWNYLRKMRQITKRLYEFYLTGTLRMDAALHGTKYMLSSHNERLGMAAQYDKYKPIHQRLDKLKPGRQDKYRQEHRAELALFDTAAQFLKTLKESGEVITPKAWKAEAAKLTAKKDVDYTKMRAMREDIKAVENLRKAADRLVCESQNQQKEHDR